VTLRDVLELVNLTPEELLDTEVGVGVQQSPSGRVAIYGSFTSEHPGGVGPCEVGITILPKQL
jgi:hypothetical protein